MAGFAVDFRWDVKQAQRTLRLYSQSNINTATAQALNRTAKKSRTYARSQVAKKLRLKVKLVAPAFKIVNAKTRDLKAQVRIKSKQWNLIYWVARNRRVPGAFRLEPGVEARITESRVYPGTFIGTFKGGSKTLVAKRVGTKRTPLAFEGGGRRSIIPVVFAETEIARATEHLARVSFLPILKQRLRFVAGV